MAVLSLFLAAGVLSLAAADPASDARALIAQMTLAEKVGLLHGTDGPYVGNNPGLPRLGIPPLNLNDGPQGFRDGGSTCWPSGHTVGNTWDADLAGKWGAAMGAEFYGKGANVQLGPGVNVARVPQNGRNFEYISGEDPFLGYTMVQPVIRGIQSQNVLACTKHYVENNQEYERTTINAVVDERTRFEMYYPPFYGAIEADTGSIMCSYNKINGYWACENNSTLQTDFKDRLGFQGWAMSDWGATHSTSINEGLDQEMPSGDFMGAALIQAVNAGKVTMDKIDDSVARILTPMIKYGIMNHTAQWTNSSAHSADVTSPAHSALARTIAASAAVLLKNTNNILPLSPGTKIALIGSQAQNPIVHGGGSGQVTPTYVVSPLQGILEADNGWVPPAPGKANCTYEQNTDYYNPGDSGVGASSPQDCCAKCSLSPGCIKFTFVTSTSTCWLHTQDGQKRSTQGMVAGTCTTPIGPTGNVTYNDGSDLSAAAAVAAAAEVAIVFVATTSSEGSDRPTLAFGNGQDEMVAAIAKAQPKTIVVTVSPGPALYPWEPQVAAIIAMNMPGLEYGHALADLLFGAVNPSGRLTISIPNMDNEVGFTPEQYPGVNGNVTYSEKLNIGYRWYLANNKMPHFPFGHGLSYTTFSYSNLQVSGTTITGTVTNTGKVAGAEIVQLYIGYPQEAGEPPLVLRGFDKVFLAAGQSQTVSFTLSQRDLSIWDVSVTNWTPIHGTFKILYGSNPFGNGLTGFLSN